MATKQCLHTFTDHSDQVLYGLYVGHSGDRTKLLPYTNFYIEVLTQFRIKLLHVEVLVDFQIKLLHVEVLTIFPDKTSTLTKLIKDTPPPPQLHKPHQ